MTDLEQYSFRVGKIVGTHGLKGEVKINSITDFPEVRYQPGNTLLIKKSNKVETIESSRKHKNVYLIKFVGLDTYEDVIGMNGSEVFASDQISKPELAADEFYYRDIIGLNVVDVNRGNVGKISEILSPGANDVWVVKDGKKEILLPYIKSVVLKVDIPNKSITVDIPEGLID